MYDILLEHLQKKISLTDGEQEKVKSFFLYKRLKKRQFLLQEGDNCKYMAFVSTGLLRAYNVDEKGIEHMQQFSPEGWWTSDMSSFFNGGKALYYIDALEDSEVLLITAEDLEHMTLQVPAMDRFFRLLFQNSLVTKERRLVSSNTHTAEEKYLHLMQYNPDLIIRIPQKLLASYLGLTPATVSRLKKRILLEGKD